MNNAVGYASPTRFANPVGLGTDGIGADMLDEFRVGFARLREADVTRPRHGVGMVGNQPFAGSRSRRRHGHVVVRPDGPMAAGVTLLG